MPIQPSGAKGVAGTPLLDIKPYISEVDAHEAEKTGWLSGKAEKMHSMKADERFS